jgi:hypothetical protein
VTTLYAVERVSLIFLCFVYWVEYFNIIIFYAFAFVRIFLVSLERPHSDALLLATQATGAAISADKMTALAMMICRPVASA